MPMTQVPLSKILWMIHKQRLVDSPMCQPIAWSVTDQLGLNSCCLNPPHPPAETNDLIGSLGLLP